MPRCRVPRRVPARLLAVGLAGLVTAGPLATGLTSASAATAPNLVITEAGVDRTTLAEGDTVRVSFVVKNKGAKKAGRSSTRFYLTRDWAASLAARKSSTTNPRSAPQDIRLVGEADVKAVRAGKAMTTKTVELTVPIGTQPGSYTVVACADDKGKVAEKNEADNCTPAGKALKVTAPDGNDELTVQQFADTTRWPEDEEWPLQYMKIFCGTTVKPKAMTLSGALGSIRAFLTENAEPGAMELLAESGQADTALTAQQLTATALAEGSPGLALASLIRAHEVEPRNASHLINAASLAAGIGLPNEALALLDASVSRELRRPAMGVSQHAIAMVTRGQALLMTGRASQAELMFKAAKAAEPMLSEADSGLAMVEACKDNDLKAARFLRKSYQRSQEKDTTTPTEEPTRPEPVIDRSFGKESLLRQLIVAETPSQGVDLQDVYDGIAEGFQGEIMAHNDEQWALEDHLRETDEARSPAEIQRRNDILMLVYGVSSEPDVKALRQKIFDKLDVMTEHREEFWGGGTGEVDYVYRDLSLAATEACAGARDYEACRIAEMNATCIPELNGYHSDWRAMLSELQNLANEYFAVRSERMSAYASNLLDEEAHRLALLSIEQTEQSTYALIVQQAQMWTHYEKLFEEECVEWQPLPVEDPEDPAGASSNGPCPKDIAAMNLVANVGPTKVKITCEKVQQEVSHEVLPLLHAFAEVSFEFKSGRTTVFFGSKGEGKLGVVEGGFKSGAYLTFERNGDLYDAGWRVGPSASVGEGAAEFQVYEDLVDISVVKAFTKGE